MGDWIEVVLFIEKIWNFDLELYNEFLLKLDDFCK